MFIDRMRRLEESKDPGPDYLSRAVSDGESEAGVGEERVEEEETGRVHGAFATQEQNGPGVSPVEVHAEKDEEEVTESSNVIADVVERLAEVVGEAPDDGDGTDERGEELAERKCRHR
jgi:hypothetical protein